MKNKPNERSAAAQLRVKLPTNFITQTAAAPISPAKLASRAAPLYAPLWQPQNNIRASMLTDDCVPILRACAALCWGHRAFGTGHWASQAPGRNVHLGTWHHTDAQLVRVEA